MEQQTAGLKQCITEITHKAIAKEGNNFIYLDSKKEVESIVIEKAEKLKKEYFRNAKLKELNKQRKEELDNASITLGDLKLDADEKSQERMARALAVLEDNEKQFWVSADNVAVELTKAKFKEALKLAGANQTAIWSKYALLKEEFLNE